jgi:Cu(I)/Ag(I) efflux system membrane protein CusA/SilA
VIEDQVTYPLTTAMLSVPHARAVRGFSMFGDSFVYVLFEDGTDLYWARSRVLEYLSQVTPRLPKGAIPTLGPDATGVGWIYEYALVDRTHQHDLAQLRAIQDWFLKYELRALPGVAEIASVGGMVRQYQVVLDPARLRAFRLTVPEIRMAIGRANGETGGSIIESGEAEYMIRSRGYLSNIRELRSVPLGRDSSGAPILLEQVAAVRLGPELRRGIAELDGEGEVAGGVVILRHGGNGLETIRAVSAKLESLKPSLPKGIEIVPVYDRSALIERAVGTLTRTLIEEFIVIAMVCVIFLGHLRSSLVALVVLPLGILVAFLVMRAQGINANIMSLGGIAIAIGAMVDAAIVMIENVHKHRERADENGDPWQLVLAASREVAAPLFYSLLIITVSFLPVFVLEAQEGRLFKPLAYTKTFAMAAAAGLSITLVPVLMGFLVRGRIRPESASAINRLLQSAYRPLLDRVLAHPSRAIWICVAITAASVYPAFELGSEFMPDMDEGDILYMPTTLPGLSPGKAQELLQQTDRILKTFPEVAHVFGKAGRADTATDPAPLSMFETTITLKPGTAWRPGMTTARLIAEMRAAVKLPGLPDVFVMPIKTRIDMLTTGIRTPIGIKVLGPDLSGIEAVGRQIEQSLARVPGTVSAFAERTTGARYIEVRVNRLAAASYGFNVADIEEVVSGAVGGANITESVEGRERYPVNLRFPYALRDSPERLRTLPIPTETGRPVMLGEVADIALADGPDMIKSENARLSGWISVDIAGRDIGSYVADARAAVARDVKLPPGYSLIWTGQYEYLMRAAKRLGYVIPATLTIIVTLLFMHMRRAMPVLIILGALPLAFAGGFWLLWMLDYRLSVAVAVGFIALGGLAVEIGIVMFAYFDSALARRRAARANEGRGLDRDDVRDAVVEGALARIRPVTMTKVAIIAALAPIMWSSGTGSEAMSRIAAPMLGGMLSVAVLTLIAIPAAYYLWQSRSASRSASHAPAGAGTRPYSAG